jgi:hypothetical protein
MLTPFTGAPAVGLALPLSPPVLSALGQTGGSDSSSEDQPPAAPPAEATVTDPVAAPDRAAQSVEPQRETEGMSAALPGSSDAVFLEPGGLPDAPDGVPIAELSDENLALLVALI